MKKTTYIAGKVLVDMIAPVFGIAMVIWIFWNVETRLFPIVTDFKIQSAYQTPNNFTAIGTLNKRRNCEVVGMTIYKLYPGEMKPKMIIDQYRKDLFSADAGTGEHSWGPVSLPLSASIDDQDEIQIVALHRCHALWLQQTEYMRDSWINFKRHTLAPPALPNVIIPPEIPKPLPKSLKKMQHDTASNSSFMHALEVDSLPTGDRNVRSQSNTTP